jgi:hypothetical protein
MSIRTLSAALIAGLCLTAPLGAGEGAAVIVHPNGSCTSCEVVPTASTYMRLSGEHPLLKHRKPLPTKTIDLCPGACFGYFPTQWRTWDEACGLPGHGAAPMIPPADPAYKNGRAPNPRSVDPMNPMKMKSGIAPLHAPLSRIN